MESAADLPVIDISGNEDVVASELVNAAMEHGFLYIKNSGKDISQADLDEAFTISDRIFDSPLEEKQKCKIKTDNRGWAGMQVEALDPRNHKEGDFKEAFNFGEFVNVKAQQPLPTSVQPAESRIAAFAESCHTLCRKLLHLLGRGLEIQVNDFFSSAHSPASGPSQSILRFLRYPPPNTTAHTASNIRAGAHSDYGSITLLFRLKGQAGLELLSRDNKWLPVPVSPPGSENDASPPILVNIGDLLSYWTGGLFRSTVHRVSFPTENAGEQQGVEGETNDGVRRTIVFFCHPANSTKLEPVPSKKITSYLAHGEASEAENTNPYAQRKVLTAEEHLFMRLKESYGSLYDEKN